MSAHDTAIMSHKDCPCYLRSLKDNSAFTQPASAESTAYWKVLGREPAKTVTAATTPAPDTTIMPHKDYLSYLRSLKSHSAYAKAIVSIYAYSGVACFITDYVTGGYIFALSIDSINQPTTSSFSSLYVDSYTR
jgi:hypothetical protein